MHQIDQAGGEAQEIHLSPPIQCWDDKGSLSAMCILLGLIQVLMFARLTLDQPSKSLSSLGNVAELRHPSTRLEISELVIWFDKAII